MFHGKPLYMWNLEKCLKIFPKTFVSSDDPEILEEAFHAGAVVIPRPEELCGDTPNIPVYQHALEHMGDVAGIVAVQANSPTLNPGIIAITQELMEMGVPEAMTMHKNRKPYGSVWAIKKDRLLNYGNPYKPRPEILLLDDSIDIHTQEDFDKAVEKAVDILGITTHN